ncbi:MAG: hypothetical protein VKN72_17795 [Nostocales cyanobacterium 94392]|nr:hypothetical protein [Nostocales cyanobacterium 94392]
MSETGENNVLNQLRNKRNRKSVPPRLDALVPKPAEAQVPSDATAKFESRSEPMNTNETEVLSHSQQNIEPETPQPMTSEQEQQHLDDTTTATSKSDSITELKAELEKYPQTKRHSAIVLEKDLSQQLTQFCKEQGITVETFLEAAWTIVNSDDEQLGKITTEAKHRYDQRKRVGQLKRLITMLSNS